MSELGKYSLIAAAGSLALLLGALAFQYIGGLAPCQMCIWQRWPHLFAVIAGILVLLFPNRVLAITGAIFAATTALIGIYHTGVERKWWMGPQSCTAPDRNTMDPGALLDELLDTAPVLCDEVAWEMLGLSMASWNALATLALVLLWLRAAWANQTP